MARAKRTDRAEARRRYRAALAATRTAGATAERTTELPAAAIPPDRRPRATESATAQPRGAPERPSFRRAVQEAIRPADIRADLAAFPAVALRSKAIWLPSLLAVVATALGLFPGAESSIVAQIAVSALLVPPQLALSFFAGMLAPRASYLAGLVVGVVAGVCFALVASATSAAFLSQLYGFPTVDPSVRASLALNGLALSPVSGILFGAFGAFYRRLLAGLNPRTGQRRPTKARRR